MPPRRGAKKKKNKKAVEHVSSSEEESGSEVEETPSAAPSGEGAAGEAQEPAGEATKEGEGEKEAEAPPAEGGVKLVKHEPITVLYCPVCTYPGDLCEYGGNLEECKPWLTEVYLPAQRAKGEATEADVGEMTDKVKVKKKQPPGVEVKPGGKVKMKNMEVTIQIITRKGKRSMTTVTGLHNYGVNLKQCAKDMKKKFAAGSSVDMNIPLQVEQVEVQGEFEEVMPEWIASKYPNIPKDVFRVIDLEKKRYKPFDDDDDDDDDSD